MNIDKLLNRIETYLSQKDLFRGSLRGPEETELVEKRTVVYGAIRQEFGNRVLEYILMTKHQGRLDQVIKMLPYQPENMSL